MPGTEPRTHEAVIATMARRAREAARVLAKTSPADRERGLRAVAAAVREHSAAIIEANRRDLAAAEGREGMTTAMIDRLRLDETRLAKLAAAVDEIAALPDLVGRLEREEIRPNGLVVARMRIPLGVIAMIYESRPNVTVDAAALCLKSANAVILRGGSEAIESNRALGAAVSAGLEAAGLPVSAAQVVPIADREAIDLLLQHDREIDLVIPRGGEGLIRAVAEKSRIPVLRHYKGVCHLYVHAAADLEMALAIAENAKVQRPGVCNALETILIDEAVATSLIPPLCSRFAELGVEVRGDPRVREIGGKTVLEATEDDWGAEYLDKIVAVRVVPDFAAAVAHIETYGSDHTESIITRDPAVADEFLRVVNSSTVMVNASTRFADGGELGLGAEIGISTTRLHAYGPMGAEGLTTTKFVVKGEGQVRTA
jgi:glutamate-5-semialdehyde dehydrogenase